MDHCFICDKTFYSGDGCQLYICVDCGKTTAYCLNCDKILIKLFDDTNIFRCFFCRKITKSLSKQYYEKRYFQYCNNPFSENNLNYNNQNSNNNINNNITDSEKREIGNYIDKQMGNNTMNSMNNEIDINNTNNMNKINNINDLNNINNNMNNNISSCIFNNSINNIGSDNSLKNINIISPITPNPILNSFIGSKNSMNNITSNISFTGKNNNLFMKDAQINNMAPNNNQINLNNLNNNMNFNLSNSMNNMGTEDKSQEINNMNNSFKINRSFHLINSEDGQANIVTEPRNYSSNSFANFYLQQFNLNEENKMENVNNKSSFDGYNKTNKNQKKHINFNNS